MSTAYDLDEESQEIYDRLMNITNSVLSGEGKYNLELDNNIMLLINTHIEHIYLNYKAGLINDKEYNERKEDIITDILLQRNNLFLNIPSGTTNNGPSNSNSGRVQYYDNIITNLESSFGNDTDYIALISQAEDEVDQIQEESQEIIDELNDKLQEAEKLATEASQELEKTQSELESTKQAAQESANEAAETIQILQTDNDKAAQEIQQAASDIISLINEKSISQEETLIAREQIKELEEKLETLNTLTTDEIKNIISDYTTIINTQLDRIDTLETELNITIDYYNQKIIDLNIEINNKIKVLQTERGLRVKYIPSLNQYKLVENKITWTSTDSTLFNYYDNLRKFLGNAFKNTYVEDNNKKKFQDELEIDINNLKRNFMITRNDVISNMNILKSDNSLLQSRILNSEEQNKNLSNLNKNLTNEKNLLQTNNDILKNDKTLLSKSYNDTYQDFLDVNSKYQNINNKHTQLVKDYDKDLSKIKTKIELNYNNSLTKLDKVYENDYQTKINDFKDDYTTKYNKRLNELSTLTINPTVFLDSNADPNDIKISSQHKIQHFELEQNTINLLNQIKELQKKENKLFKKLENTSNKDNKKIIINEINVLVSIRVNLYKNLKMLFRNNLKHNQNLKLNIEEQEKLINNIEKELNRSKNYANKYETQYNNKLRLIQNNMYYTKKYTDQSKLILMLIVICVILTILSILNKIEMIPSSLVNICIIFVLFVSIILIYRKVFDMSMRNKFDYDNYDFPFNKNSIDKKELYVQDNVALSTLNDIYDTSNFDLSNFPDLESKNLPKVNFNYNEIE